jgi:ADP-ribosylglycohydrolase
MVFENGSGAQTTTMTSAEEESSSSSSSTRRKKTDDRELEAAVMEALLEAQTKREKKIDAEFNEIVSKLKALGLWGH